MSYKAINFQEKFGLFEEHWAPKVVAEMNDYQFKVVKVQGDFIWHDHKNTDETFIVIEVGRWSSFPGVSSTSLTQRTRSNYCSSSHAVCSIPAARAVH